MQLRPILRINYQPIVVENIQDIKRYFLSEGGQSLALRMIKLIRADIAALSEHPNKAPSYELMPSVRRLVVLNGLYLVFYRITQVIEVLYIRRSERMPATAEDFERN
ncbi:MAG: type II toxin-antitoxin system RelE/ParE family toxin [Sulfuriferula sp.]|nr:type II toxin-antitoxin system RelE/ParE family toxin [Sulfuriferula sp.]